MHEGSCGRSVRCRRTARRQPRAQRPRRRRSDARGHRGRTPRVDGRAGGVDAGPVARTAGDIGARRRGCRGAEPRRERRSSRGGRRCSRPIPGDGDPAAGRSARRGRRTRTSRRPSGSSARWCTGASATCCSTTRASRTSGPSRRTPGSRCSSTRRSRRAPVRDASYSGLGDLADLALATFSWGWHLEAGTAALRLMGRGVLDRHPTLQLVLGHWARSCSTGTHERMRWRGQAGWTVRSRSTCVRTSGSRPRGCSTPPCSGMR